MSRAVITKFGICSTNWFSVMRELDLFARAQHAHDLRDRLAGHDAGDRSTDLAQRAERQGQPMAIGGDQPHLCSGQRESTPFSA